LNEWCALDPKAGLEGLGHVHGHCLLSTDPKHRTTVQTLIVQI